MNIQWYPGHMTKAKRQMAEQLKQVDAVLEIVDARIPASSRNPDFNNLFAGKIRLQVLNKSDLAEDAATKEWIDFYNKQNIATISLSANERKSKARLKAFINEALKDKLAAYAKKRVRKDLLLMAVGIPNSGKSSIINLLSGASSAKTGNKPGVTRGRQLIRITDHISLVDTPGVLWPKFEDETTAVNLALTGAIKDELLDFGELAIKLILKAREGFSDLMVERYKLDCVDDDPVAVLEEVCRNRGFLVKGGEVDYDRGAKTMITEFRNGLWGPVTMEKIDG